MALHKDFPQSPHAILDPGIRWFPADEALRESSMEKLMPPLVAELRRKVKEFREAGTWAPRIPAGASSIGGSRHHTYCQRPTGKWLSFNITLPSARRWRRYLPLRCGGG